MGVLPEADGMGWHWWNKLMLHIQLPELAQVYTTFIYYRDYSRSALESQSVQEFLHHEWGKNSWKLRGRPCVCSSSMRAKTENVSPVLSNIKDLSNPHGTHRANKDQTVLNHFDGSNLRSVWFGLCTSQLRNGKLPESDSIISTKTSMLSSKSSWQRLNLDGSRVFSTGNAPCGCCHPVTSPIVVPATSQSASAPPGASLHNGSAPFGQRLKKGEGKLC